MQLHKRLANEQVRKILEAYETGGLEVGECQELLGVSRSRFFELIKKFRSNRENFCVDYKRQTSSRLDSGTEQAIFDALQEDYKLVNDPQIPITTYNYSAVRDRVRELGYEASVPTIIERAKRYKCYQPKKKKRRPHDTEVITTAPGALVQHDSSFHLWSPYASEKWSLVTSLDDYARLLLFADLYERESTWAHIEAAREVSTKYGVPLKWYTDQLRTFRFVASGESFWTEQHLKTDQVNTQWKQCILSSGSQAIYALSPQAKGKIERPYRWLQDRVVRICAREQVSTIEEARQVLQVEVNRYNTYQVHSTTGQVPIQRFRQALTQDNSLFSNLTIAPHRTVDDIFCLRLTRTLNAYRKISLQGLQLLIPKVPHYEEVNIHLIPNRKTQTISLRIWWRNNLILTTTFPRSQFPKVHF